jgi:transcriptional regulator with GAF, ATPase, and Fis domain
MILSLTESLEVTLPGIVVADTPVEQSLEDVERRHILTVLQKTHWRVTGKASAAEILGLKGSTLQSRMKKLGIRRPSN